MVKIVIIRWTLRMLIKLFIRLVLLGYLPLILGQILQIWRSYSIFIML